MTMLINEDLTQRALVHSERLDWVSSPAKGVDRRMLFRIGGEKACATSIVRYAAGSRFTHQNIRAARNFGFLTASSRTRAATFRREPTSAILQARATHQAAMTDASSS